jgi:hypothetical protein
VVHAAPGAPKLDVTLDGARIARDLGYGEATDSQEVAAGWHALEVVDAQSGGAFASQPIELPAGPALTLVLSAREGRVEVSALADGFGPPRDGHIRLRLMHAAPLSALAVDLDNDGAVEVNALEPGEATAPEGFELKANTTTALRLAGAGRFTVPALPSASELLLVLTGVQGQPATPKQALALLGLAPSAVLGFISPETGIP